ncbi:uncharacterized protein LOC123864942 isoform X2 [Maniola jurtina]|uniref:uncharacterized protein LOC123864942 isoform X2 n=1 Tax=Maniola jurtina TaxID=191418 RepID=UPI001E68A2DD|nr:uncharacterized protein LOC123864942 isoform X2 [Maniola jurtina]
MNWESTNGIGGAHIKPSARKSIHSHCSRCSTLRLTDMGRYGAVQRRSVQQDQGQDEVDNVISKMARPASPIPLRNYNRMCRRNSYDVSNESSDDDSEEDDEIYTSANTTVQQNELQNSRNMSTSSNLQNSPEHQRVMNNSTNRQNQSFSQNLSKKDESSITQLLMQILLVFLVACSAVFYLRYYPSETTKMNSIYDKMSFYNDVMDLGEKYKVKDTSILQVRTGIATIFEKQDTGSFIFAYNSKSNNFNPVMFNNFIEDLAATASRYLRNESVHHNAVVVDTVNLKMQTEKEFMNQYEPDVAKTGVMLVKDIDNIPAQLAMAFHYYCDEYSPLVRRSAIFFTLNLARCSNNSDPKSTHEYIEKCLAKKWSAVGEDRIGPLLTRVVNIVVDVTSVI